MRRLFHVAMSSHALTDMLNECEQQQDFLYIDLQGVPFYSNFAWESQTNSLYRPLQEGIPALVTQVTREANGEYSLRSKTSYMFNVYARGATMEDALRLFQQRCEEILHIEGPPH